MSTTLIISVCLLLSYIIAASVKLGKITFSLTKLAKAFDWPWRALWYVAFWGGVAFAAPSLIGHTPNDYQFLAFLSLAAAIIYGFCASLEDGVDRKITTIAGWVSITLIILCMLLSI
jgi:hypothetical protein